MGTRCCEGPWLCGGSITEEPIMKDNNGKKKSANQNQKRGRWSAMELQLGQRIGPPLTPQLEHLLFQAVAKDCLVGSRHTTLACAYRKTLAESFCQGWQMNALGFLEPILKPASELPSYRQFRYVHKKYSNYTILGPHRHVTNSRLQNKKAI